MVRKHQLDTTSGMYGHSIGLPRHGLHPKSERVNKEWIESQKFEIEIAGERYQAKASLKAFYDPNECPISSDSSILKRLMDPNTRFRSRFRHRSSEKVSGSP